ncbi:MAG: glycogen/starch synthase [Aliidongia sp.]
MKYRSAANGSNRLRVLFVSSEIFPLAKTGGLADVCSSLPIALSQEGDIDMMLMLPGYDSVFAVVREWEEIARLPDLPGGPGRLLLGTMPETGLQLIVLDQPQAFRRPGNFYLDEQGKDWGDNAQRFAALCHAAATMAMGLILPFWRADIVHCNDCIPDSSPPSSPPIRGASRARS